MNIDKISKDEEGFKKSKQKKKPFLKKVKDNTLKIKLRGYCHRVLDRLVNQIREKAVQSGIKFCVSCLPNRRTLVALQKSPTIYGASKDHFQKIEKIRAIFLELNSEQTFTEIFKDKNILIPAGIDLKVERLKKSEK